MTNISSIHPKAREALRRAGVHAYFGYGDVYHFEHFFGQEHTVDVPVRFTLDGLELAESEGELMPLSLIKKWYTLRKDEHGIFFFARTEIYTIEMSWATTFLPGHTIAVFGNDATIAYLQDKYPKILAFLDKRSNDADAYEALLVEACFFKKDEE